LIGLAEFVLRKIAQIKSYVEMALNLKRGGFGNVEKALKFRGAFSSKALGYIRHNGDRGSTNLIPQSEIPIEPIFCGKLVNVLGELTCFLPSLNLFKSLNPHNWTLYHNRITE